MTGQSTQSFTAIVLARADHVAHALVPLRAGDTAQVASSDAHFSLRIRDDIPRYHKFAIVELTAGTALIKGGEVIGRTRKAIHVGGHVHTHNLQSSVAEEG